MLSYLKRPKILNPNAYKKGKEPIVVQDEFEYKTQLFALINKHRDLVNAILPDNQPLPFPIGTEYMEAFLSGYEIEYRPFKNTGTPDLEGFCLTDPDDPSKFYVHYNTDCSEYRQRYTKIHETIHVCQSLDLSILDKIDELLANPLFPEHVVKYMLERVTEKAVAMYMMPEKHFKKKYLENPDLASLSKAFAASAEAVKYRLLELGLPQISKVQ